MDEIKIESGIPIPTWGREAKYPFGAMDVGQSFALPFTDIAYKRLRAAASLCSKLHPGIKFRVSKRKDEGVVRVWRVA